jgi:hypothetical protein
MMELTVAGRHGDALIGRLSREDLTPEERGQDAYDLLQEIFAGYPASGLLTLLRSDHIGSVETAVWVLSELGKEAAPLINEIEPLLSSPSRKVRYWAIDVVNASAGPRDGKVIGETLTLLADDDIVIRHAAAYFLARASGPQLSAAVAHLKDSKIGNLVAWLGRVSHTDGATPDILRRLESDDPLVGLVAAAAALRISAHDKSALERAADLGDDDISLFASRELGPRT